MPRRAEIERRAADLGAFALNSAAGASNAALNHVRSQPRQNMRSLAERNQSLAGALRQLSSTGFGRLQTQHARVGGLGAGGVGPAGLADLFGLALNIEDVILDLKRESDVLGIAVQRIPIRGA